VAQAVQVQFAWQSVLFQNFLESECKFTYLHTEKEPDNKTYSVPENVTEITNQFDNVDPNYYEGSVDGGVTYLSRSDWTGTFPEQVKVTATQQMIDEMFKTGIDEDPNAVMPTTGANNGLSLITMRGLAYESPL